MSRRVSKLNVATTKARRRQRCRQGRDEKSDRHLLGDLFSNEFSGRSHDSVLQMARLEEYVISDRHMPVTWQKGTFAYDQDVCLQTSRSESLWKSERSGLGPSGHSSSRACARIFRLLCLPVRRDLRLVRDEHHAIKGTWICVAADSEFDRTCRSRNPWLSVRLA